MSLFRPEVFEHRKMRLYGDVSVAVPFKWHLLGVFFFGVVIISLIFVSLASYSRVENVGGILVPGTGVANVVSKEAGVVSSMPVSEGQLVSEGDVLAIVSTENRLLNGSSVEELILKSLNRSEREIAMQSEDIDASADANAARIKARITGLESELENLALERQLLAQLLQSSGNQLMQAQKIAERGFVSKHDILKREEAYLGYKQQMTRIAQKRSRLTAELDEAKNEVRQNRVDARVKASAIESRLTEIERDRAATLAAQEYQITAPLSGRVTSITGREGNAISSESALLQILPVQENLIAELHVPSSAIGFLQVDQEVSFSIDAFPYQRFGTVKGKITQISNSPSRLVDPSGKMVVRYLVRAELEEHRLHAFGQWHSLMSGMNFSARITTKKQNLLSWLFEPIYAISRR